MSASVPRVIWVLRGGSTAFTAKLKWARHCLQNPDDENASQKRDLDRKSSRLLARGPFRDQPPAPGNAVMAGQKRAASARP
jgi:hypothetical protein